VKSVNLTPKLFNEALGSYLKGRKIKPIRVGERRQNEMKKIVLIFGLVLLVLVGATSVSVAQDGCFAN